MRRLLVLLGDPVAHSLSPRLQSAALHALRLDAVYVPLRVASGDLGGLLRGVARAGGAGNVTLPHKEAAARVVEEPTPVVRRTGACNTFWLRDGRIHGDNTDVEGFRLALDRGAGGFDGGGDALVLGAGGAARAAVEVLSEQRMDRVWVRNRTVERARSLARDLGSSRVRVLEPGERIEDLPSLRLVVNATRLGLAEDDELPVDPSVLPGRPDLMDLVYRPEETAWVRKARAAGLRAWDGGEMLVEQGAVAFERWWALPAPREVMRRELDAARQAARAAAG